MASGAGALSLARLREHLTAGAHSTPLLPTWSKVSAVRALRAVLVIPGLFAIADQAIGNLQLALFAAFGGFATLVLANFGGTRRDQLSAHAVLAVTGSVLLTIGTAVNTSVPVAAVVTVIITFAVFFAGVVGPNAASGGTAALLAYVLPAASPGTMSMVPDRLAGWWLVSVVGTVAVLTLSPRSAGGGLRAAASRLAGVLARELEALIDGEATDEQLTACIDAKQELRSRFIATPLRPTGLAAPDQAMANLVQLLEWCTSLLIDSVRERSDLSSAVDVDRALLGQSAAVLRETGSLLSGGEADPGMLERLEQCRKRSIVRLHALTPGAEGYRDQARLTFHAHAIAVTVLAVGADALVAARIKDADWVVERAKAFGRDQLALAQERPLAGLTKYAGVARSHASIRSVWFINSMRAALALGAAVAVADLSSVQHGFWVVLGTLSVLRTNASSTGSTALRALAGTAAGFAIGAALLLAIGTSTTALWVALPIAVFVAAYAPGAAPFAVGQAAFTVLVAVLFNLLVPVGWKVGVVRIEDVAIGCAVSVLAGILLWPRGVASVVGDDLADAFRAGAGYLSAACRWVCGLGSEQPAGDNRAIRAGLRLDEALRAFLAEQGTKHLPKEDLWRLVGGTMRLRLTAHAVAELPRDSVEDLALRTELGRRAELLDSWYEQLAAQVGAPRGRIVPLLPAPVFDSDGDGADGAASSRHAIWLREHLDHLTEHLDELIEPAAKLAAVRRRPWWR